MQSLSDRVKFYQSILGRVEISRNEKDVAVKCPFCGKEGSDKKKLVIRVADDTCHCWVCGFKSRSLIPLLKKIAPDRLPEYIERFYIGPKRFIDLKETSSQPELKLPLDFRLITLATKDPDTRAALNYLERRGLDEKDIWRYKLGISNEKRWYRRIIFPSFSYDGTLNYYTGRGIDHDSFPKYDTPPIDKLPIIFNEIFVDWTKELVLCEGPFDVMKCGDNAVPLLGSSLSEESYLFEQIIINRTPIALALDADMRYSKTPKIAKKLSDYSIKVRVVDVETDPGDMTRESFAEALQRAEEPRWSSTMLTRLARASRVSLKT